jgi:hypothetical protein
MPKPTFYTKPGNKLWRQNVIVECFAHANYQLLIKKINK